MSNRSEEIAAGYELDKKNRRPPVSAKDIPFAYEDITAEWLTAILCAGIEGAKVVAFSFDAPDIGSTSRQRIVVDYNQAGRDAGLPLSVFCKATHSLASRMATGFGNTAKAEVNFYNIARPLLDVEAPVGCFANFSPSFNSIVVLRDLGPGTTFCTHTTDITRGNAEDQMRLLAKVHGKFLESPVLDTTLSVFPTWHYFFSSFESVFKGPCDQGFAIAEDVIPARLFARRQDVWGATMASVERHLHLPHTLNHGDDHLRNWYITADGRMGLGDWQAATRGHWSRDLIYGLLTSLSIDNRRLWMDELLRCYMDHLQHTSGRKIPFDGVLDEIRRQMFTVLAFWTITINPVPGMPEMQPRDSTVEFIRRIASAMDDFDAFGAFK